METDTIFNKQKYKYKRIPRYSYFIFGGAFLCSLLYCLFFLHPRVITFAYSGESCVTQPFVAPSLQKQTGSEKFTVYFKHVFFIHDVPILATQLCIKPKVAPTQETQMMQVSLFGGIIGSKHFRVVTPKAPVASIASLNGTSISTIRPLVIRLSSIDTIYNYTITGNNKSIACDPSGASLSCDVSALQFAHNTKYTLSLYRDFAHSTPTIIAEASITTAAPNQALSGTIADGQVLYDKPTSFTITFDHPLDAVTASLTRQDGDKTLIIPSSLSKNGTQLTVSVADQLPRSGSFTLTITKADGTDGSSLATPIIDRFTTSAGPKVASVSVGTGGVASNAQIIVTFDQPIDASVDIHKFAHLGGVSGSIQRQSPTQIIYTLQDAPRCAAFSLQVDKGIKSGSNDESSAETWGFTSRIVCGTSSIIGYSVNGRPITAYTFGNGATTILFTGGMHGMEPSGATTMQAWVKYLQLNGDKIPNDKRIVVVPNTNPDGIASNTRNNSHGVNIDRNFATANWSASIDSEGGQSSTGGGTSPASEPETQALVTLTQQLHPRLEVSFHSQGSLVGANKYADSVTIGDIYASTAGYATMYYKAEAMMGYTMTGEYEDWMGEQLNIPAILIELPGHSGDYLNSQLSALLKMVNI